MRVKKKKKAGVDAIYVIKMGHFYHIKMLLMVEDKHTETLCIIHCSIDLIKLLFNQSKESSLLNI